MLPPKKEYPKEKIRLHIRNKHRERYDFHTLIRTCPELESFVKVNRFEDPSIDFFNPDAVKMLNTALLKQYYDVQYWDIPMNYLCPPIPGRADYIHYMADLLGQYNQGKIPTGQPIKCLDVGVGANCVYPIIGSIEYGWSFVGSDIDAVAIDSARNIIEKNMRLIFCVEVRAQAHAEDVFTGIIQKNEQFDITVCNPPFHASLEEATSGTLRKLKNLNPKKVGAPILNFSGQPDELYCKGGEVKFITDMIYESKKFANSCFWFSTLVAKQAHVTAIYQALRRAEVVEAKTIPMGQGNKTSRIIAWTFLAQEKQKNWARTRWDKM